MALWQAFVTRKTEFLLYEKKIRACPDGKQEKSFDE
jgi:hypothetical protein